jgi:hypothetical protein
MVALSYPRTFTVGTAGIQQQASGPADESRGISGAYSSAPYGGWDPYANYSPYGLDPYFRSGMAFGNPYACGPFGYSGMYNCDAYNPYGYGAYGYGRGGYGGYGYNPYGYNAYGYNGGYNGWMYGGGIIVIEGNGAASQPHGRVVAGRGYTQGSGSASTAGRDAQPRPRIEPSGTTGSGSSPQPRSSGGSSGGSQPSSGGSSSSSGSSSGSSTGGGRTAHPKPPSN